MKHPGAERKNTLYPDMYMQGVMVNVGSDS